MVADDLRRAIEILYKQLNFPDDFIIVSTDERAAPHIVVQGHPRLNRQGAESDIIGVDLI